jgi:adenylate kinase family enzyme
VIEDLKINILGASGSGKTTLAKVLAEKFGCAHFDSDDYYHYPTDPPFQRQRSPEDRLSLLMGDLRKSSSWILSGGAAVWVPAPAVDYSLVVFLYLPQKIRLARLHERELKLYGKRLLPEGDMEKDQVEFMKWTRGYDGGTSEGTNTLPIHLKFLAETKNPTLKIDQPMTTEEQVMIVQSKLKELYEYTSI